MSAQLDIPGNGATLTERQKLALQFIEAHQPVPSDALGAFLHDDRQARGGRGHAANTRCEFCTSEGAQMGRALRRKGLVTQKRHAGWCLPGYRPATGASHDVAGQNATGAGHDDRGFPEGF